MVIHSREAEADTAAILEEEMARGRFKPLLHCFTSKAELARRGLALGAYVSFSGILTYKSAADIQATAGEIPLDRLLVETDAPYLAPVPYRGKTNEPAFVVKTLEKLAEIKGVSREEMARTTSANFFRLFLEGRAPADFCRCRMTLTLTILGCGSSGGVPRIGNHWGQCDPANPKNRRRRCSLLVRRNEPAGRDLRPHRHVSRPARADAGAERRR